MPTDLAIDGERFLINGRPTYTGVSFRGRPLEGLLFNARMVQAIFDDACAETCERWRYPDTGRWDPARNTAEFCAQLPAYRAHGLLAVTVGLQGGGSIYAPEVYDRYDNSAFTPTGEFRPAYFERLAQVLRAADAVGMVVIVNYFYWKQVARIPDDGVLRSVAERVTAWLLDTGHRNLLIDVANEAAGWWHRPLMGPERIHELIDLVRAVTLDGRRLWTGSSAAGDDCLPTERWLESEDVTFPHGNGCTPAQLAAKLRRLRTMAPVRRRPRPIVVNEDSVFVENLEAAAGEGCSWGYYDQGYGSGYRDRIDWTAQPREDRVEELSGFQTVPVNWSINTAHKRAFFARLKTITSGGEP